MISRKTLSELERECEKLWGELAAVPGTKALIGRLRPLVETLAAYSSAQPADEEEEPTPPRSAIARREPDSLRAALRDVLPERGPGLKPREATKLIRDKGFEPRPGLRTDLSVKVAAELGRMYREGKLTRRGGRYRLPRKVGGS